MRQKSEKMSNKSKLLSVHDRAKEIKDDRYADISLFYYIGDKMWTKVKNMDDISDEMRDDRRTKKWILGSHICRVSTNEACS